MKQFIFLYFPLCFAGPISEHILLLKTQRELVAVRHLNVQLVREIKSLKEELALYKDVVQESMPLISRTPQLINSDGEMEIISPSELSEIEDYLSDGGVSL